MMPEVPVSDPFGNRVAGKSQDRVPAGTPGPMKLNPVYGLMAAATMHEMGRLFDPEPISSQAPPAPPKVP